MSEELELYDKVTLASGKEFNCDYLATIPNGFMFIAVVDESATDIIRAFTDPTETDRITYGPHVLEHYKVFVSLAKEGANRYKLALRKAFADE